jgi:hypothetical protein
MEYSVNLPTPYSHLLSAGLLSTQALRERPWVFTHEEKVLLHNTGEGSRKFSQKCWFIDTFLLHPSVGTSNTAVCFTKQCVEHPRR